MQVSVELWPNEVCDTYCFSNSSTKSLAFLRFSSLSYVSSSAVYPFHCTRYLSFLCIHLSFIIFSTFYSSSPSIIMGCGLSFFCPSTCSIYLRTCKALDQGCVTLTLNPLFIGDWQRELVRVLAELCILCNDKASRDNCLITLNVMRERRELDGVSWWIVLPTYTLFLFVYVYA